MTRLLALMRDHRGVLAQHPVLPRPVSMHLPGLWVYSVPIYEDGPGWGWLGLPYRLVWPR